MNTAPKIGGQESGQEREISGQKTQKSGQKSGQKTQELIVNIVKDNPYITSKQLCATFGINRSAIIRHLKKLKESGVLRREGPDKGGHWVILKDWEGK